MRFTRPARDAELNGRAQSARWLRLGGLFLIVGAALVHGLTPLSPLPGWDLDPLLVPIPLTGLGPGGSMFVDAVLLAGAACLLLGEWLGGSRIMLWAVAAFAAGTVGLTLSGNNKEPHVETSWIAAMAGGLALAHACRDGRMRRLALAVLVGFVVILGARGWQQRVIEQPQTIREFRQNRERFFEAQGWSPDSPMAKSYERRVVQSEATGWFGLANVYATFAAGGSVAAMILGAGVLMRRRKLTPDGNSRELPEADAGGAGDRSRRHLVMPILAAAVAVLCLSAVWLADSKGGVLATLLGLVFAGAALVGRGMMPKLISRIGETRWGGVMGVGAAAATMSLVIARGLIGNRIGEASQLSLLFRWYYLEAAARIGWKSLVLGCGADGFQRMYLLLKNPLNPEEVTSSHNVLSDWWACAGIWGVAWIGLWISWMWRAGAGVMPGSSMNGATNPQQINRDDARDDGAAIRLIWLVGIVATLLALRLEQPILTMDLAGTRLIGLLGWFISTWMVLRLDGPRAGELTGLRRLALGGAAVAMGAHALIDQTGVWPGSCAMLMLLIGAAAAPVGVPRADSRPAQRIGGVVAVILLIAATVHVVHRGRVVFQWERLLVRAAKQVEPAAEATAAWQRIGASSSMSAPQIRAEVAQLFELLNQNLGRQVQESEPEVHKAMNDLMLSCTWAALADLEAAEKVRPMHAKTLREISRLHLIVAQQMSERGRPREVAAELDRACAVATQRLQGRTDPNSPVESNEYGWASVVYQSRFELTKDGADLRRAEELLEESSELDPYGLETARRLMRLNQRIGDAARARTWAIKALELDELRRLDREVQGLSESERLEARRLAGTP